MALYLLYLMLVPNSFFPGMPPGLLLGEAKLFEREGR